MRISDWSSDVCSSDLAWLTPRWAAAFTSSNVSTKHVGEAVFALMVTTHQCEQSRSSDPPRGTGARFDSAFDWIGSTRASRSEEHTSELQSLMRISYAVFCLKKKKNQNNTHQREIQTERE